MNKRWKRVGTVVWLVATSGLLIGHGGFNSTGGGSGGGDTRGEPCGYSTAYLPLVSSPVRCVDGDYPETAEGFYPAAGRYDSSLVLQSLDWGRLDRLEDVTALSGDWIAVDMPNLQSFEDLTGLQRIGGNFALSGTGAYAFKGLQNLRVVGKKLALVDNGNLESLSGLALDSVGDISIGLNSRLSDISALGSLRSLGMLNVWGNTALDSIAGIDPAMVRWQGLGIADQRDLRTVSGFNRIDTVVGVQVSNAPALTAFTAFSGTRYMGTLSFTQVPQLSDVSGLAQLQGVYSLVLEYADQLSVSASFPSLVEMRRLVLTRMSKVQTLDVSRFAMLEAATLMSLDSMTALQFNTAGKLSELVVTSATRLASIEGLAGNTTLQVLVLQDLPNLKTLDLPTKASLKSISVVNTGLCQASVKAWVQKYYPNASYTVESNSATCP